MTGSFLLTLDTHAPVITWGAVEGADAGETLVAHYTINEPEIISAELELPFSSTRIPLVVGADTLSGDIPGDSFQGTGLLFAYVEDDVGNTATRELAVALDGVVPPVQVPSTGGMPRGRDFEPRVVRDRSRAGSSARDRVRVHVSSSSSARVRSHYRGPTHRTVRFREAVTARSSAQITARMSSRSSAASSSPPDVIRRREGPDHQAELILLDIL